MGELYFLVLGLIFSLVFAYFGTKAIMKERRAFRDQQDQIAANQEKILRQQGELLRRQRENKTNDEP